MKSVAVGGVLMVLVVTAVIHSTSGTQYIYILHYSLLVRGLASYPDLDTRLTADLARFNICKSDHEMPEYHLQSCRSAT